MPTVKRSYLPNDRFSSVLKLIPTVVSGIVTLIGTLVLLGWILKIDALKSVFPGLVSMKPNAAIAFLFSGISLWLLYKQPKKLQKRRIGQVLAVGIAIFGLLTLSEYIWGWNFGFDRLLFSDQLPIEGNFPVGRVAINSALNFLLIGIALAQVSKKNPFNIICAQVLALIASLVALQPLLGYVYMLPSLYQISSSYKPMALHTALCFVLLCVGILGTNPQQGVMQRVTSQGIGGFVVRRLLLAAIAIPLILGWLIIQGYKLGLYDTTLGLFFLLVASIVVFAILIWQTAGTIERLDRKRQQAEVAIRQSQERYQAFIEQSSEGIWRFELEQPVPTEYSEDEQIELFYQYGYLAECNNAMAQMYGFDCAEEIVGARLGDFLVRSDANNIEYLRNFIRSNYRLNDGKSHELDKEGNFKYFANNLVGVIDNGVLVRAWGTQRDITEPEIAQTALQESEARLRRLVDANIVGIILASFDGKVIEANNAFLDMIGYTREELLSGAVNFVEITPPEFRHLDEQAMAEMKLTGRHHPFEKEYIRKDGSRVPVLVGTAYLGGSQNLGVGYLVDLSERKRTEDNLKQLSNQLQAQANTLNAILAASVDNIYIVDCLGRYLYVSAGAAAAIGFKQFEVVGKTWQELGLPAEVMESFDRNREQVLACGKPLQSEAEFFTPNGLRHYEYIVAPLNENETIQGVVVVSRDITDRKQFEEALKRSETRFRSLVEQSPLSTQILSPDGKTIQVNCAWEQLWGITLDQIPDYNMLEDEQLVVKGIMPYIKKGFAGEATTIPAILYNPDESIPNRTLHQDPRRWVSAVIYPVKDENGAVSEVVLVHEDITAAKLAQEALRISEAKFRRLADANVIGVITADFNGNILEANDAFLEILGYTRFELLKGEIHWRKLTPPEFLGQDEQMIAEIKRTGVCPPFEKEYIRKDGSRVPVVVGVALLEEEKDKTICFVLDLSDRKQAELALRESEARFRNLADTAPVLIWMSNVDKLCDYFNQTWLNFTGRTLVQELGNGWLEVVHPDDAQHCLDIYTTSFDLRQNFQMEYRIRRFDGEYRWILDSGIPRYTPDGTFVGYIGCCIDISDRKLAELALQQSQEQLQVAFDAANLGMWDWNLKTGTVNWLGQHEHFFGLEAGTFNGTYEAFKELIYPEDVESVEQTIRHSMQENTLFEAEFRVMQPDGSMRWIAGKGRFFYEGDDLPIRQTGVIMDITNRKQVEETLRRREEELRLITNAVPVLISYIDSDLYYRFTNQRYEEWFGCPATEIEGRHLKDVLGAAYEPVVPYIEAVMSGQQVSFETQMPYEYRGMRYINATYVPRFDKKGEVEGFVALVSDISDRKYAEQEVTRLLELEKAARAQAQASERRFRFLAESIPVQVWTAKADGKLDYVNQRALQYFNCSLEQVLGSAWQDMVHPEERQQAIEKWHDCINTGKPYEFEFRLLRDEDTSYRWHLARALPLAEPTTGQIISWFGTNTDIEEQKRNQESLQYLAEASGVLANSLDYETTLKNVADLAVAYISDWCAVDMVTENQTIQRMAVAHPDPAKVKLGWELSHRYPRDINATDGVPLVIRTGQPIVFSEIKDEDLVATVKDPEYLEALRALNLKSCMIVPLVARGRSLGTISFIVSESGRRYTTKDLAFAEDLARRAALAVDNARLYQEAQQANRMKDEFLATLSHELRTPLNAMLGWTQLLRTRKFNETTAARALETIDRNTKSLAQLIEDVLDVSRIITGKLRINTHPVEVVPIIEGAIETVLPAANAKDIRIEFRLEASGAQVLGDAARLQQVLWNLLSNAIKFTPKGGGVEVELEYVASEIENQPLRVQIKVSDTGQGIKPDFLPYVFERFRQADGSTTRNHGGLGLGLAIVRHLVELHGGTVQAESQGLGKGATFTVKLPLLKPEDRRQKAENNIYASASIPQPLLEGLQVLVVDDEPDARELLVIMLEPYGVKVTTAASASEALEIFIASKPDILVSDLGMPKQDGYSLIRKIRQLAPAQGGQIPAIALTAYAGAEDRIRALAAGFQLHVPKPVNPEELAVAIANLLGRS